MGVGKGLESGVTRIYVAACCHLLIARRSEASFDMLPMSIWYIAFTSRLLLGYVGTEHFYV